MLESRSVRAARPALKFVRLVFTLAASALFASVSLSDTSWRTPAGVSVRRTAPARRAPAAIGDDSLPCSDSASFQHVIIAAEALTNAFGAVAQYRRDSGMTSVVVSVEDIVANYGGIDTPAKIRAFITDAYEKWGVEYVLLGGDTDTIPARLLFVTQRDEFGEIIAQTYIPSDLYYQCLDGDFDANGNGIYGEPEPLSKGGDEPDIYSEVKIGRVPARTADDVTRWFTKMKRYDTAFSSDSDKTYRTGALFVSELLEGEVSTNGVLAPNALVDCYGASLMEQIRIGSDFPGNRTGIETFGFCDATNAATATVFFDYGNLSTIYDRDHDLHFNPQGDGKPWTADEVAEILNSNAVSIVNHVGHSDYLENMRIVFDGSTTFTPVVANTKPVFIYSQGCKAGAFDENCIAEAMVVGSDNFAFGGVWNSRDGQYLFVNQGVNAGIDSFGRSQYIQRRFWDAVFRLGVRSLGGANALSHELNAGMMYYYDEFGELQVDAELAYAYFESNLFGDPAQLFGGPDKVLTLDREAYRSDATASVTYEVNGVTDNSVVVLLSATDASGADLELSPRSNTASITLTRESVTDALVTYAGTINLSSYPQITDGATIKIALDGAPGISDAAAIDDVAPQIADVVALCPDDDTLIVSWTTDEETIGLVLVGASAPVTEANAIATAESADYATSHSVTFTGLAKGLYYVSVIAADKAANTNSIPANAASATAADYIRVIVSPHETRAFYDMESGVAAWSLSPVTSAIHTNCWELGVPKYGPIGASRCWGTVLDGRYPNGANDCLVSPPVTLRANPAITFRQWYDIQETPLGYSNLAYGDCGIVEICASMPDGSFVEGSLVDGTWRNISDFGGNGVKASYQGTSDGWESVRVNLPPDFAGMSVRIRFRFISDNYPQDLYPDCLPESYYANPAGWYIDGVAFLDTPEQGVILSAPVINGNTGDGRLPPAQNSSVVLSSFNHTFGPIMPLTATVSISAVGYGTNDVSLAGGASSVDITYPATIDAGNGADATETIEIDISQRVTIGTVVVLTQTMTTAGGAQYVSSLTLTVAEACRLSGTVSQPNGAPLIGAMVSINGSDGDFRAVTDDSGAYEFAGVPRMSPLTVSVSYGLAATNITHMAELAAETLDVTLPVAEIAVDPTEFIVHIPSTDDPATNSFFVANIFNLAALDGNVGPSANLDYEITGHLDDNGSELDWFQLVSEPTGSVAPNAADEIQFVLDPRDKDSSRSRSLTLAIRSNAWNEEYVEVNVTFVIDAIVEVDAAGDMMSDDYYFVDYPTGPIVEWNDYDGQLEPGGEIGWMRLAITNLNAYETISRFEGRVQVVDDTGAVVTIMQDDSENYDDDILVWRNVGPHKTQFSDDRIYLRWTSGTTAHFIVTGDAYFRSDTLSVPVQIHFYVTTAVKNAAASQFTRIYRRSEVEVVEPVAGARVMATGADGKTLYSSYTDDEGNFLLSGLLAGENYWISYETAEDDMNTALPPAYLLTDAENIALGGDTNGAYIAISPCGNSYPTNTLALSKYGVTIADADGDRCVDPGEEFNISVSLTRKGLPPQFPIHATVTTPDFERGVSGQFIEITDLVGAAFDGTGADTLVITGICARAQDTAVDGDFQRFLLTITDSSEYARTWNFDFKVVVESRSMIRGSVVNLAEGGVVRGTRIAVESADGTYYNTATVTDNYANGDFAFGPIAAGTAGMDFTVSVVSVPRGYACTNKTQTIHLGASDVILAPFELIKYGIDATGSSGSSSGEAIALTVAEGESTSATITIANSGVIDASVNVKVVYNRKPTEILSPSGLDEATVVAALSRTLASRIGDDWTALDKSVFSTSEIEVLFKEGTPVSVRDEYLARHGFRAKYHFKIIPASIAVPDEGRVARELSSAAISNAKLFTLRAEDADCVVAVQPSVICHHAHAVPNDELYPRQWALSNTRQNGGTLGVDIGAEEAWEYAQSFGSSDVIVAVTDSGIDYTHPDLAANVVDGYNFVSALYATYPPDDYSDNYGHGTHVAGIIGAVADNSVGVAGVDGAVSLLSCRIYAVDPLSGEAVWATSGEIAQAFEYACLNGAKVNNNSWSWSEYSSLLDAAIIRAQDYDMLFVCASGGAKKDDVDPDATNDMAHDLDITRLYPAALRRDNVIVVAATDSDGHMAGFSNYSPTLVHLAAPGVDIYSTYPDGGYVSMSGTSMAAPFVSGAAAFLYSLSPDASYVAIKDALLGGVRKDEELARFVSTSGILDLGTSVKLLGRQWLRLDGYGDEVVLSTNISIAAGASVELPFLVNDPARLSAGTYSAKIYLSDENGSSDVPVTLTVTPAAVAEIAKAEVLDANGDGCISSGEETTLSITVRNVGSRPFQALTGSITGPGADQTVVADYDYVSGGSLSDPGRFAVTIPSGATSAEYVLTLYEGDGGPAVANLPVTVSPIFDGTFVEVTVTDGGEPVSNAVVEVVGASAGRALTGTNGVARIAVAASSSTSPYVIRVIADGAIRASGEYRSLPASETFELEHNTVVTDDGGTEVAFTISEGSLLETNVTLVVTNDLTGVVTIVPRAKIAVIDDSDGGAALVAALRRDGYDVTWLTNNYSIVTYLVESSGAAAIKYEVNYSWDDATLCSYDAVIALVTGANGSGRLITGQEGQAYANYIARGGKVFFAGNTVLARPDNAELAAFLGFGEDSCNPTNVASQVAILGEDLPTSPFLDLSAGDAFPAFSGEYDAVFAADASSGDVIAEMDDQAAPVAKIFRTPETPLGGRAWLWNGLAGDWASEGAALDILRGTLYGLFYDGQAVDWLTTDSSALQLSDSSTLQLSVNPLLSLPTGEYEALLLVRAPTDNGPLAPIVVKVTVEPPALRAWTSGAVTDWGGRDLKGDGGPESCMVQIIYAGPDGIPDPPAADGSATGDDVILAVSGTGAPCTYIGSGAEALADTGRFDERFALAFPSYTSGDAGVVVYARAWDGPSASTSIAYGDSATNEVTYSTGTPDAIDFGSWSVTNTIDSVRDLNGDGIPDAWARDFRSDIDSRDRVAPLATVAEISISNLFDTAKAPQGKDADGNPARVFVTDKFVFVLEEWQHRIAVYNREYPYAVTNYFGATTQDGVGHNYRVAANGKFVLQDGTIVAPGQYLFSNAAGGFNKPFGMAYDTFCTNLNRFAVADTGNGRVQLFTFDPDTAEITFVASYGHFEYGDGSTDADGNVLREPKALSFMKGGRRGGDLLVADTGNYRVLRLGTSGNSFSYIEKYPFDKTEDIAGICYDEDTTDGFWVATDNDTAHRRVSFHHTGSLFSSTPVVSFTFRTDNSGGNATVVDEFRDVQVWTVGASKRLCVIDYDGSRLFVLGLQKDAGGAYTDVTIAADVGYYGNQALEDHEKLWHPNGVFPLADTNIIYVADYGHEQIKWYALTLDGDGDGMDDIWEEIHGLDSTVDDSMDDADGDGLPNIGEYRAGTDPHNADTDGDGYGDMAEMAQLTDPLDPDSYPFTLKSFISIATYNGSNVATNDFLQGSAVRIVATFDDAVPSGSIVLTGDGGVELATGAMTPNGATLVFDYTASSSYSGPVSARITVAECDPPVIATNALFNITALYFRVTSATFYDANGNPTNIFTKGDPIRLDVHFDTNDNIYNIGLFYLKGVGGDWTSSVSMPFNDGVASHTTYAIDYYTGVLAARLSVYGDEIHLETNLVETITIVDPSAPPTPPALLSVVCQNASGVETNVFTASDAVTVVATFDAAPSGGTIGIVNAAGTDVVDGAAMTVSGNTLAYTYTTTGDDLGWASGALVFTDCTPAATNITELFQVVAPPPPPPALLSVICQDATGVETNVFTAGAAVKVVATFDSPVTAGTIELVGTNDAPLASGAMTSTNDVSLFFDYTASSDYHGPVSAILHVPVCDPPVITNNALFTITAPYFRVTSVTLYDKNNVATNVFEIGEVVSFEIAYESNDTPLGYASMLVFTNGIWNWTGRLAIGDGVLTSSGSTTATREVGTFDIKVNVEGQSGTVYTTDNVASFRVIDPTQAETTEEAPWRFTSISVTNNVATLAWAFPSANVPSDGKCDFRIEWRQSLTSGAWSASGSSYAVTGVTSAAGCVKTIQLSELGNPAHCFFRLFWTNKVE